MRAGKFITYRDFPSRPQRHAGESLVGYIYRLLSANGHAISAGGHYRAVQQLYRGDLMRSREPLQRLSAFIGDPSYQDSPFWAERLNMQYSGTNPSGLSFPKLRADSPWMCPACMQEAPYHREYWTLPLANTCPRHGVSLSACCEVCGGALTWTTLETGWRCARGHIVYEASPIVAESTARDRLFSIHAHFAPNGVEAPLLQKYRSDAAIHEMHIAYYWVSSPRKVGAAWGLSLPRPRATANNPTATRSVEPANSDAAPLSHAFLRWVYLWRIVMRPLGAHIPTPLTFLSYAVRRRPARTTLQHARRQGKRTSAAVEPLHARRVMLLPHMLVYLSDLIPKSVGLSALSHLDRWWPETVQVAKAAGLLSHHGLDGRDAHTPKRRQTAAHRMWVETAVVTLLDRLLFAACMLFNAHELQGFWKSLILPRSLPGNTRKPTHKRLTAYLMTCPLTELTTWNTQIEAGFALRHQEFCDALR